MTGEQVYQAILEDDLGANSLIADLAHHLGTAIGTIYVPILDPELVVIGGGVSVLGERLLAPIRSAFSDSMPAQGYRPELEIVGATFLNQAGLIGAADLARQSFAGS